VSATDVIRLRKRKKVVAKTTVESQWAEIAKLLADGFADSVRKFQQRRRAIWFILTPPKKEITKSLDRDSDWD
jgi:hypothetical protein